uniref:ABC transporter substrate-binding protein n=1 Tax=Anisakis simplex TaxID=6269 RepID=A0A0M3IYG9_ANISI
LDVWNEPYEDNADLVLVDRIEIVNYTLTTAGYEIDVKYWKKFLVENWRSNSN